MDTNKFQKGIAEIKEIKLAAHEKQAMFARLLNHIDQNPITEKTKTWRSFIFVSPIWHRRFVPAIAVTLIIFLAGGSTIFASEAALPGDLLYPIKINVAEPVRDAVTIGVPAKAKWAAEKASRRLDEATKVASEGRLNQPVAEELQKQFTAHVKQFNNLEKQLEKSSNTEQAVSVNNEFEAQINARVGILRAISDHSPVAQKQNIRHLEDSIKANTNQATQVRAQTEKNYINRQKTLKDQVEEFKTQQKDIRASIKKAREQLKTNYDVSQGLRKEILDNASATLYEAENNLDKASKNNQTGDQSGAYTSLFSAKRGAAEANISIGDSLKFKQQAPGKILNQEGKRDNKYLAPESNALDSVGSSSPTVKLREFRNQNTKR